jgi:hypothetical protein
MPWAQRRRHSAPRRRQRSRQTPRAASRGAVFRTAGAQGGARRPDAWARLLWLLPAPMCGALAVARVPRYEAAGGQPNWRLAATLIGGLSTRLSAAGEKRQTSTEYEDKF